MKQYLFWNLFCPIFFFCQSQNLNEENKINHENFKSINELSNTITKINDLTYCDALIGNTIEPSALYFSTVNFLGTLNDTYNNSTFSDEISLTRGYQDFTLLPNKSSQVQGGGVNVYFNTKNDASGTTTKGKVRAWIDWNANGVFEDNELVYSTKNTGISSATFGFAIPEDQTPGDYRLRLRTNFNSTITSCNTINDYGETEDYMFTVLPNCAAQILSAVAVERCGTGGVQVQAQGSIGTTKLRWYTSELGGTYVETDADPQGNGSYTFLDVKESTTFYVAAYNGVCESLIRKPVRVNIKPTPLVSFNFGSDITEFCGKADYVILSSAVEQEEVTLIEEDFENNSLGEFTVFPTQNTDLNNRTKWQVKTSTFVPNENVWYPAISSGPNGNKFAFATSDIGSSGADTSLTANNLNTEGFSELRLSFDVYFSYYGNNDSFMVEISTDGTTWETLQHYTSNLGIGTRFQNINFKLDNRFINQNNLSIRFKYKSGYADGIALDNIRFYGMRPLIPSFMWTAPNISVFNSDCKTPYNGATQSICIKANDEQITNFESWDVNATVSLANGCSASGNVNIKNNNKVWDTLQSTDWATNNWMPNPSIPTIDKCVIVKTPLVISQDDAQAKSIRVDPSGSLLIRAENSLTVDHEITNNASADQFIVENDANLIQIKNSENQGDITIMRTTIMKKNDYTYWGIPVKNQIQNNFSSGKIFTYNEWNDYFTLLNSNMNFGENATGYAIQTDHNQQPRIGTEFNGTFVGIPKNGLIETKIERNARGFNLIGNPYPSNIDFAELYAENSDKIHNIAYFWTNINHNPESQGSNYPNGGVVNNYAILNGMGGIPATNAKHRGDSAYQSSPIPNEYIKVGQGFIIKKREKGDGVLVFNNTMRTDDRTGYFFKKKPIDRYWLELKTPLNIYTTILIGYIEEATNDFEIDYDAAIMTLGSDAFYSILGNRKLGIQGRASFDDNDIVYLGTSHHSEGEHTISISKKEGVFASTQSIFLKDLETGIITDLVKQDYTFEAKKGISDDRFIILYKNGDQILQVMDEKANSIKVFKDIDSFVVKVDHTKINVIEVYDAQGRVITHQKMNQNEFRWSHSSMNNGIYIFKIHLENGDVFLRKILK